MLCTDLGLVLMLVLGPGLDPGLHPGSGLPLCTDFITEDKISKKSQREEEDCKDDEIQVEFGIKHVQFFQDGFRLLEMTQVILITVEIHAVQTIDGQDDTLKPISGTGHKMSRDVQKVLVILRQKWKTGFLPDVGDVGYPLQVPGDGVKTDEES